MAQKEATEKKPKKRSRAGIVLLILLLLLAGAGGYLYYSVVKAPLELDDPQKLAASAPMKPEERFRFSADGTAQIRMDKGDIWSLIIAHAGNDFMDIINEELSSYGLRISGCAIRIAEEGMQLDLELYYKETRLVAKVPCSLEYSNGKIMMKPAGVYLGTIPLPVSGLLSSLKLEYGIELPVITEVTRIETASDELLLTGPMEQDIRYFLPEEEQLHQISVFCEELQLIAEALRTDQGFGVVFSYLEQNPGSVEDLYRDLFTLAHPKIAQRYLDDRYGMTERFFPRIDFDAAASEQTALAEEVNDLSIELKKLFTHLVNTYNEKKFRLSDGEFLLNRKPFRAAEFGDGQYDSLYEVLDPESFFLILVDAENGFIRKTSSFYRIADEKQQFTQEVDFNKTYILGCVFRSVDGEPFLLYESEIQGNNSYSCKIVLLPITEETVAALQEPGKFGVWIG